MPPTKITKTTRKSLTEDKDRAPWQGAGIPHRCARRGCRRTIRWDLENCWDCDAKVRRDVDAYRR